MSGANTYLTPNSRRLPRSIQELSVVISQAGAFKQRVYLGLGQELTNALSSSARPSYPNITKALL